MSNVGDNETLAAATAKLQGGWSLENLPLDNNDKLWEDVKKDCELTNPQLSSLKNIILLRNKRNINNDEIEDKIKDMIEKRMKVNTTPGKKDAVFLLLLNDCPVGTCFAIDQYHLLSARHNLFNTDQITNEFTINIRIVALNQATTNEKINVQVIASPEPLRGETLEDTDDWVILKRIDNKAFRVYIHVQSTLTKSLKNDRPYITIYQVPISFQEGEKGPEMSIVSSLNRVIGAVNGELRCNDLSLISKGSCGGPYVDNMTGNAIGFHVAGATSLEGEKNQDIIVAISNVPVGLHFDPQSSLVLKLKELKILVLISL